MTPHKDSSRPRADAFVGLIVVVAVVVTSAFVFGARPPFGSGPFEIQADVTTAGQLREGSPVRLGGVDIGRVTALERRGDRARLALRIDENADAIHADARIALKPRLVLGGSDYVELSPGTPSAPPMRSGGVVPVSRTSVPVQLDEVLDIFDLSARDGLKASLRALATGLGPAPGERRTGAQGLRRAAKELDDALVSVRRVARAARGQRAGDLRRAVRSTGDVTAQLAQRPARLAALVDNYDRVLAALASQDDELADSVRELAALTSDAPRALRAIDRALPPVRRVSRALQPVLRAAPPALTSARRALDELTGLVGEQELRGVLTSLRPATRAARPAVARSRDLLAQLQPVSRCVRDVVLPTLEMEVPDGKLSSGRPVWQDALHAGANLASFSNSFDGNGTTIRAEVSESELPLTTQLPGGTKLYGQGDIVGVAPQYLQSVRDLQFRPDAPCSRQRVPNLGERRLNGMPAGVTRAQTEPGRREPPAALLRALLRRDRAAALRALNDLFPDRRSRGGRRPPIRTKPSRRPRPVTPSPRQPSTPSTAAPVRPGQVDEQVQALGDGVRRIVGGLLGPLSGAGGGR